MECLWSPLPEQQSDINNRVKRQISLLSHAGISNILSRMMKKPVKERSYSPFFHRFYILIHFKLTEIINTIPLIYIIITYTIMAIHITL